MRIAVTGASGRLGGQIVSLLATQTDADVVALSRRPSPSSKAVTTRTADYGDLGALRRCLADAALRAVQPLLSTPSSAPSTSF